MDLDIRQSGNICTLKLKGRLVSGEPVNQFENAFQAALASGHIFLILDLEALPYIDSSGIGSVVNALRMSTKLGGNVKLVNPAAFVSKTFKMVGILSLFGVHQSEADAVAACGGSEDFPAIARPTRQSPSHSNSGPARQGRCIRNFPIAGDGQQELTPCPVTITWRQLWSVLAYGVALVKRLDCCALPASVSALSRARCGAIGSKYSAFRPVAPS